MAARKTTTRRKKKPGETPAETINQVDPEPAPDVGGASSAPSDPSAGGASQETPAEDAPPRKKRKYTRRKKASDYGDLPPEIIRLLDSPQANFFLGNAYTIPHRVATPLLGIDCMPDDASLEFAIGAMRACMIAYGGAFLKWMPAIMLASAYGSDTVRVLQLYRARKAAQTAAAEQNIPEGI